MLPLPLVAQYPCTRTERATTLGSDHWSIGLGTEYLVKQSVDQEDLPKSLLRLFRFSAHLGVASNVDFDLDWSGRLIGTRNDGTRVSDWGDLEVSTVIMALREYGGLPALGIKTTVKLPNTSYLPAKLGSDQTDFYVAALASRSWTPFEVRLNLGLGILGNPRETGSQDDLYMGSASVTMQLGVTRSVFVEVYGYMGYEGDDRKTFVRTGFHQQALELNWSLYGSARLGGSNRDFGASFSSSEDWSIGVMLARDIHF